MRKDHFTKPPISLNIWQLICISWWLKWGFWTKTGNLTNAWVKPLQTDHLYIKLVTFVTYTPHLADCFTSPRQWYFYLILYWPHLINSYSASHDNWCTATLWNRIMTAQCEGMGEVGSARYEPALLPPCPSIRVLCYRNCQSWSIHPLTPPDPSTHTSSLRVNRSQTVAIFDAPTTTQLMLTWTSSDLFKTLKLWTLKTFTHT